MSAAQWRARDVARKTALSQIQSAIVVYQGDKGYRPGTNNTGWLDISSIKDELLGAWMNSIPEDPLKTNVVKWLWSEGAWWQFRYMVLSKNRTKEAWFVLMAKTEVEWWSNWVVCENDNGEITEDTEWRIKSTDDVVDLVLCSSLKKVTGNDAECKKPTKNDDGSYNTECTYTNDNQLRYILTY